MIAYLVRATLGIILFTICRKRCLHRCREFRLKAMVSVSAFCGQLMTWMNSKILMLHSQARFIAQIIIVGAQVVGRAFTQALRQEFQSE